jgi:hypothetical protein
MSQENMDTQEDKWLTLPEFSLKHGISISTLRRRIKRGRIEHRKEAGKYLLKDVECQFEERGRKPIDIQEKIQFTQLQQDFDDEVVSDLIVEEKPVPNASETLLNELKKAYSLILQEKEELIYQLREEISDLKTLVRVLESENNRLKPS